MSLCTVMRVFDVFLYHIKAHLKDVVILEGISKALFLLLCIYVAEFLRTFRMLDSHLLLKILYEIKILLIKENYSYPYL